MLRDREKAILVLGGAAAALILLVSFVIAPDIAKVRTLSKAYAAAGKELAEFRRIRPELEKADREVRQKAGRITANANATESPLTRLTASVQEAGFPQSAMSLKSAGAKDGEFFREESFDLRMENLTYLEAVKLLSKLENGPLPLVIRSVSLKSRYDDPKYLDATLRIDFLLPPGRR